MNRFLFLVGLFLLCLSVLVLQIALTRVLSVVAFFHTSFLAISVAMFGLTVGAVWVYLRKISTGHMPALLPKVSLLYGLSTACCMLFLSATTIPQDMGLTYIAAVAQIVLLIGVPLSFAGIAIALCLTKGPGKVGVRYAVDLVGAALGCLLCLPLLNTFPAPVAVFAAGSLGILSSFLFWAAGSTPKLTRKNLLFCMALTGGLLFTGGLTIGGNHPDYAVTLTSSKSDGTAASRTPLFERWNSFSQITLTNTSPFAEFYWGAAKNAPQQASRLQWMLYIDGLAGTPLYAFNGDYASVDFLEYDVTNLAYFIRKDGKAGIIGSGGGRDVLSARHFGFEDVAVVELNPIMVDLLTKQYPYVAFAGLSRDPAIRFTVDEGRSWFARTQEKFDLIQMSMVDTWAATGAGSFTLSENGLYTVEGWKHFINALAPAGVLTVSRWYGINHPGETSRLVALAKASLLASGISTPESHLYLAGVENLATLILSRAPLTAEEIETLDKTCAEKGYTVLLSPNKAPTNPVLAGIMQATTRTDLDTFARSQPLDASAPTDDRPFFFNQLKLSTALAHFAYLAGLPLPSAHEILSIEKSGVLAGNIVATNTLALIIAFSLLAIVALLIVPTISTTTTTSRPYAVAGTGWFFLIGFGFMLVEIGTIQRMSLFLGHPVYGLSIVLFSLILFTGLGSFASEYLKPETRRATLFGWITLLASLLALTAYATPDILALNEGRSIIPRASIAIGLIAPCAFLMGFGFPIGMRLAEKTDPTPMPWFWGINGAAGVLGSSVAVLTSVNASISTTLAAGAVCYALLAVPALVLHGSGLLNDRRNEKPEAER